MLVKMMGRIIGMTETQANTLKEAGFMVKMAEQNARGYYCPDTGVNANVTDEDIAAGVCAYRCQCGHWHAIPFNMSPHGEFGTPTRHNENLTSSRE